ncbi:MAG TPA: site-2 protease family protein [Pyrinomonadaceae bacterium]|jgi:Zn-dependent protease|nr:site-2 protease family protein [Pyrinomonadaceae bacterium]
MESNLVGQLIIYIVVLLLAISAHEAAHAWMSYKFGDDTAYLLGRVTLNPVAHTDPIGTLLIPIVNFIGAVGMGVFVPLIGWGKPTPVNPLRWRNKDLANVMVSLAGIMANLLLAVIGFAVLKICLHTGMIGLGFVGRFGSFEDAAFMLLAQILTMNVSLAIFNLLPVPPLDGSKVLYTFLPASAQPTLEALEQFSFIILIGLMYFGVVRAIMSPVMRLIEFLLLLGLRG